MEAMEALQTLYVEPCEFEIKDFDTELVCKIWDGWKRHWGELCLDQTDTISDGPARGGLPQTVPYSVILWGESGCGKTTLARVLLPKALIVSHMDDLCQFDNKKHDGIIFDDMAFNHIPREAQIHLVDNDISRSIHCRYKVAKIPAKTYKLFTTNVAFGGIFDLSDKAIERRVKTINFI